MQPTLDLQRHDDVPTRDNFPPLVNPSVSLGRAGAVGSGGAVGIQGAAWSVMPESLWFNLKDAGAKKLVKIVNMGSSPLR